MAILAPPRPPDPLRTCPCTCPPPFWADEVPCASLPHPTPHPKQKTLLARSCSGAIGPLLRYLRDHKHNDAALRAGLHTLSLLVTNSPNRGIIVSFHVSASYFLT